MANKIKKGELKKFFAKYSVSGRFFAATRGADLDGLLETADEEFTEADFGEAEDIDGVVVDIENGEGHVIYDASYGAVKGEIELGEECSSRYRVSARYIAEVDAHSLEEVFEISKHMFEEADFGEMEDVDGELISIENADGDFVYTA